MNKIFNWLFGACFRTLGRFLAIIMVLVTLLFIGSKLDIDFTSLFGLMRLNAATLTSYDTWTQYQNGSTSCGSSGKYSYTLTSPSVQGQNTWYSGNLNSTISGKAHDLAFSFNQALLSNTYYDITINFMSNDLRYYVTRDNLSIYSGSSCQAFNSDNIAIVSFTNNATSSKNTNVLKLRIFNANISNYWHLILNGEDNFLTSVNTFGIKSISITQVEDSSTEDIINNNNQNTEDIINNDNANTDRIEGAINEQLGDKCTNLIDFPYTSDNRFTITALSNDYYIQTGYFFEAKANTTYKYSYKSNKISGGGGDSVEIFILENGKYTYVKNLNVKDGGTFITSNTDANYYLRFDCNQNGSTCEFWDLMISEETSNYCKYGSYISKLDGVNDSLNDINDTLTDTSDIDISSLENMAGWLPPGPVDSILNLPLTMLNSILNILNTGGCINTTLTLPFVNSDIVLPCVRSLYDKMGVTGTIFNTAGLIASAFLLFNYLLSLYKWVDETLTFRENNYPGYFDDNWGGGA